MAAQWLHHDLNETAPKGAFSVCDCKTNAAQYAPVEVPRTAAGDGSA